MAKNPYDKAPFNYIGNKYRLLPKLMPLFPESSTMVDLFCGGCDVVANFSAETRYANDINSYVIEICEAFQKYDIETLLALIDKNIAKWGLTKTDKSAYDKARKYYNEHPDPILLYTLVCFSFNYQFRFNSAHEYNNTFGKDRSSFNETMRQHLRAFKKNIDGVIFTKNDFHDFDYGVLKEGDFLYADPPYLITVGSYNDGKRGFKGWSAQDDQDLFKVLDQLAERNVFFAMSNVFEHKGLKNEDLIHWQEEHGYHVKNMNYNYNNSNYQSQSKKYDTMEVLITNYPLKEESDGCEEKK